MNKKTTWNLTMYQKSHQRNKHLEEIQEDEKQPYTNEQGNKKPMTMHKALYPRDDVHIICQEKKEEEDWPNFKIVSMHRYIYLEST